jgi:hypothetical protein
MDYEKLQNDITDFIKNNYKLSLPDGLTEPDAYIDEAPIDLDKYKKDNQLFFDFGKYDYEALSNDSDTQTATLTVYIICRNDKTDALKHKLLSYTSAFYTFVAKSSGLGGTVDKTDIKSVTFFDDVSGDASIKASSIELELTTEAE